MDKKKLSDFLEWLITPQNDMEKEMFSKVVDDYIELKNRLPTMTTEEIINEINIQLKPYNLSVDEIKI